MSLKNLYNKTVTLKRLSAVAGTYKETFQDVSGSISCSIHPVEGSQQEILEGGFYNTFKMFCSQDEDVRVGDKVIDGSITYVVKGIKQYDFAGSTRITHQNIILVKGA